MKADCHNMLLCCLIASVILNLAFFITVKKVVRERDEARAALPSGGILRF